MMAGERPVNTAEGSAPSTRLAGRRLALARATWLALAGLILGLFVLGLPASYAYAARISPETAAALGELGLAPDFSAIYVVTVDTITVAIFAAIAFLLYWRRSDDWFAMFAGVMLLLTGMLYSAAAYEAPVPMWITAALSALAEICQVAFVYLFPNGRFVPRWMGWLLLPLFVWRPLIWGLVYLPNYWANHPAGENYPSLAQNALDIAGLMGLLVLGIVAQVYRYRRVSTAAQQQQTRWLLWGMLLTVGIVGTYIIAINSLPILEGSGAHGLFLKLAGRTVRQMALLALPITLAYSILRYRLWNIDIIIRRTLIYGWLTALLGGLYVASVYVLQAVFRLLTDEGSQIAMVVATLGSAALFDPLRRQVQTSIDRRFYRRRYDAAQTVQAFAGRLRNELNLDSLAGELLEVVDDTMQPAHSSLWLAGQPVRAESDGGRARVGHDQGAQG